MIVNIRGTSGSGKTYLVRQLMAACNAQPVLDENGKIDAYRLDGNIYVLGKYTNICGGCDTIHTQDEVCDRVRKYAAMGHVIFEGLLATAIWKRYQTLSQELGGMVWAFMDTSLEQCFENIYKRNGGKPVKEQNTISKWEGARNVCEKAKEAGERVIWFHYENAFDELVALLHEEIPFYEEASV